eukprot:TRINITY_DN16187_c0_g1_i1.p1 TRINITY_DN16187_c0_g1~~TRINITY_DN16187_c0_g1_i1.p1  ORF type:complete len:359 (+),score=84.42 TRINITY_DN16187_c0_g1_i1:42-1118(+)
MFRFLACAGAVLLSAADRVPKHYTIDLATAPENRWDEICPPYKETLLKLTAEVYALLPATLPLQDVELILKEMDDVENWLPEPFNGEIKSIMKCTGLTFAEVATVNFFYDFAAHGQDNIACTGIITNTPGSGVYHGRNLDFGGGVVLTKLLRNCTVTVNFEDNGKHVMTYTGFVGLVGMWTGQKPGMFTVEGNERDTSDIKQNLQHIAMHRLPPSMFLRQAIFSANSYTEVVEQLTASNISAPVYYIVGGTKVNEGVVLTKNFTGVQVDTWTIPQSYQWFIVQTNYDHWTQPPANDDRRKTAVDGMHNITSASKVTTQNLYQVMSTPRVLNKGTIFTCIMSAAEPSRYGCVIRDYDGQ